MEGLKIELIIFAEFFAYVGGLGVGVPLICENINLKHLIPQ